MASKRDKIKLQSTKSHYFKTTTKNKRLHSEKMELMMYDPVVRRHVKFVEKKLEGAN